MLNSLWNIIDPPQSNNVPGAVYMSPLILSSEFAKNQRQYQQQNQQNQPFPTQNNAHAPAFNTSIFGNTNSPSQFPDSSDITAYSDYGDSTAGSQTDYHYPQNNKNLPHNPQYQNNNNNSYTPKYLPQHHSALTPPLALSQLDQLSLGRPPLPFPQFPPPVITFVSDGTLEFEIFLDLQQQKIEQRRPHYVQLAKEVAESFGHSAEQLAIFDVAPTREIIKYLGFHGEKIPELIEKPPPNLAIPFYIPNPDGTIPTKYLDEYLEPLLVTKIIEPKMPIEVRIAEQVAEDFIEEQKTKIETSINMIENPEDYWVITESNWEQHLPDLFGDFLSSNDLNHLHGAIRGMFDDAKKEEKLNKFIASRAKKIDLYKTVKVLDPSHPDGFTYDIVVHPYAYHPAAHQALWGDVELIEGDLDARDLDGSFVQAEKLMANLDKLHRGEYTHENYPDTDPFFEIREMMTEKRWIDEKWSEEVMAIHEDYGHILQDPLLQTPEFGYGTFTPDSYEALHELIKTHPIYRKHVPRLKDVVRENEMTDEELLEFFPNQWRENERQKEWLEKVWVNPDQDYLDEHINKITPENEHYFRDYDAEDNQRRKISFKAREALESYIARDHPHMYRQWLKFLYNEHLGSHFGEGLRKVTEADPRENRYYGEEVKQIEKMYNSQFMYERQLYGDDIQLFRPPDGNLEGTEEDPQWTEYQLFDTQTGESLVDEHGVLLSAKDYRERKEKEEKAKIEIAERKKMKKEARMKKKQEKIDIKRQERLTQLSNRSFFSRWFGSGEKYDTELDIMLLGEEVIDDDEDDEDDEAGRDKDPFDFSPSRSQYLGVPKGHAIPTTAKRDPATIPQGVTQYARLQGDNNGPNGQQGPQNGQNSRGNANITDMDRLDNLQALSSWQQLESQRERLHQWRMDLENTYTKSDFIGQDEFDLLMTSEDFHLPKEKPIPAQMELPDLHMDTIRRKIAIMNGDIEEDEEDDPGAAEREWSDPNKMDEIPKSHQYREATRYSYDQLDKDYIRKKKRAEEKYGGGLESFEFLHLIGDRYDRREESLLQRADKTTAKFRQLDKDVVRLKQLKADLEEFKKQEHENPNESNREEIKNLEKYVIYLQSELKERYQDEELEYNRLEWDGIKDKTDFLDASNAKSPGSMIKRLRRQQRMNIDYDNNPLEGENFKDAYIRERIEIEQSRVKSAVDDALEHHPSLAGTIHIKDRRDIMKLTQLLHRQFGADTPRIREAITKLPIRFYMNDVGPDIDQKVQTALIHGSKAAQLDQLGKTDRELMDKILAGMSGDGYDVAEGEKNMKRYDEIINILENDLLPTTLQSRVDQLSAVESKMKMYDEARGVDPSMLPEGLKLTPQELAQAQQNDGQRLNFLKSQVTDYNKDLIGGAGHRVLDSYNELYGDKKGHGLQKDQNVNQKYQSTTEYLDEYDRMVSQVPEYQVITPSSASPWRQWSQSLEDHGFIPMGENDLDTKREMLKKEMTRIFPALEPEDAPIEPEIDYLSRFIDADAPGSLRAQKQHEADTIKKRYGYDVLKGETIFEDVDVAGHKSRDVFHPRHMMRWMHIPTKRRIFGTGRTNWQDDLDYQKWIQKTLPAHRIHKKGNLLDRMMLPRPTDWIHYGDKSVEEVKELIWSEQDVASQRLRENPDIVFVVPKAKNKRLYDFLGELKRQVAPRGANDPDFIANLDPLNDNHAKYFYTQNELESQSLGVDFPEDKFQRRPRYSHLEDEVEYFRREKIEDYYRQRRDSTDNHKHANRLKKDKRMTTKQGELEAQLRRKQFNERAMTLGSFGLDIDPDDLDRNEMLQTLLDPDQARDLFSNESTKDDPTRFLRRSHPDVNMKDYKEWNLEGPKGPKAKESIFNKMPKTHYLEDQPDYIFNTPLELKDKQGKVIFKDDPLSEVKIPGVDLKRFDPGFQGDLKKITKHDFAAPDNANTSTDNVYERYREDQFDRWRGQLVEQGNIAEQYNIPTPKLPKSTFLLKKQAASDLSEQHTEQLKLHRDLNEMQQAYYNDELDRDQLEDYRKLFHGTGKHKILHNRVIPVDPIADPHSNPYYDTSIHFQDLPAGEFMKNNPQFMGPRHEQHRAKPFHTAMPRPIPWDPSTTEEVPKYIRESPIRNPVLPVEMGKPRLDPLADSHMERERRGRTPKGRKPSSQAKNTNNKPRDRGSDADIEDY